MEENLSQLAVSAALRGEWKKAVEVNLQILKNHSTDVDALNRLAKAYSETGDTKKAKTFAQKVLEIDLYNPIATRCLERLKHIKNGSSNGTIHSLSAQTFLEEPGKTRIVPLRNLGNQNTILGLNCGEEVKIVSHPHSISIMNLSGKLLGRLPDDIANRLLKLIPNGYKYSACIKSAKKNEVRIFIRETVRPQQMSHLSSFPAEKINYVAFTAPELVHDRKDSLL